MKYFLILTLAILTGCATKPAERPASLAARSALTAARSKIMTASNRAADVGRGLSDVRKAIEEPRGMDKARALLAVRQAEEANASLTNDLIAAKVQAENADAQVDTLVQDNAKISAALSVSETEREKEAAAKRRWRLISISLIGAALAIAVVKWGLPFAVSGI